jgi:predicted transposase/invertase (TIGR01784 family)
LADPANQDLLLDFLNGVLRPTAAITAVTILNPYNPAEFVGGKETIVDVKATDSEGVVYQIELQVRVGKTLPERILYTWAHVYHGQIGEAEAYAKLKPACSIWILEGALFPEELGFHHRFAVMDPHSRLVLSPQLDIHVLELRKLGPLGTVDPGRPLDAEARWLYFLKEGGRWATLPAALQSPEMRKAMSVLERFSDAQRDLALYQSRVDYLHVQRTLEVEREEDAARLAELEAALAEVQAEKEQERAEKEKVQAEKEQERVEKERHRAGRAEAEAKLERLRQVLLAAGIDPDTSSN